MVALTKDYDQTIPLVQIGSDIIANPIRVCVHQGSMYAAWLYNPLFRTGSGSDYTQGPFLSVWNGTTWSLVASWDETLQYHDTFVQSLDGIEMASDGTNLYVSFLARYNITQSVYTSEGAPQPRSKTIAPYWFRLLKYTGGATFTDVGWFGLGQKGTSLPPNPDTSVQKGVLNLEVRSYRPEIVGLIQSPGCMLYEITASPDEVGTCYLTLYESGYVSNLENAYNERHLYIAGMDGATLSTVDLTGDLYQPPSTPPQLASGWNFNCRIVGSGSNLTWYGWQDVPGSVNDPTGSPWTTLRIWQPGGFLNNLDLATDFGVSPLPSPGSMGIYVSNDYNGHRLVGVASYGTVYLRQFAVSALDVPGPVLNNLWFNQTVGATVVEDVYIEAGVGGFEQVWLGPHAPGSDVLVQLTYRDGVLNWAYASPANFHTSSTIPIFYNGLGANYQVQTRIVYYQDAFWAGGKIQDSIGGTHTGVVKLGILRGTPDPPLPPPPTPVTEEPQLHVATVTTRV